MGLIPNFPEIHFEFGAVTELAPELMNHKISKPMCLPDEGVVKHGVLKKVTDALPPAIPYAVFDKIPENPTIDGINKALEIYNEQCCDGIVSVGGGSVLDSGKALRVVTNQGGAVMDLSLIHI